MVHARYSHTLRALVFLAALSLPLFSAADDTRTEGWVSSTALKDGARIVFSWDSMEKVPFTTQSDGNKIVLHFEKPVSLEWGDTLSSLSPYVREVETHDNGRSVVLTLDHPAEGKRHLVYGRNGIDLSKNALDLAPVAPAHASRAPITTMAFAHPKAKVPSKRLAHAKPKQKPVTVATAAPPAPIPPPAAAPATSANATPAPIVLPPLSAKEVAQLAALSPAAGGDNAAKPGAAKPTPAENAVIALPLQVNVPFAVFVKDKTLWIAAGEAAHLSEASLRKENPDLPYTVQKIPALQGTVLGVALGRPSYASVEQAQDGAVHIHLLPSLPRLASKLSPAMHTQDEHASLSIPVEKAESIILATDPVTGAEIAIAPLTGAGTGVETLRNFVEFSLLPTGQGIAVQKTADNVTVTTGKNAITIASVKGLAISADAIQATDTELASGASQTLFPYARWKLDDEKNFVPVQEKLFHTITFGDMESGNKARLRLLGLYLAEGMFPEARGMADDILRSSYKFYVEHDVAAMRGAARFFMYRITDAEADFASPELDNVPEIAFWRTLCKELLGESNDRFDFTANYARTLRAYPPVFIQKLAIIAADRAINRKDYDTATGVFDALRKDNFDDPVRKYIDYMRAKILSETHNEEEAARIWEQQTTDTEDRFIRAHAEFSLVNMLLRDEKISPEEAAKRLEKIRIVWRGDGLEIGVLTLLGSLYSEQKDYARALRTWRDIVIYFPDMPDAVPTARKMEDTFVMLYNKNGADTMPPLSALSLFYEFRDLVPSGEQGDQMIRNLADRLVSIDLLDRAAQLLEHQIHSRLQGTERSRVGAKLAEIYLSNRHPKEALDTLKTTGYGDLPSDVQLTRIRLTARALAQQGRLDKAIDVLSGDNSSEGNLLRLSVYWTNWDWPNVISAAEEILGNRNDPSATLTPQESEVLLKLATAYVYEHDSGQIQYLRDYFTPLLKDSPNKPSFLFITSESGAIDYENLTNLDKDINTVKSFIDTSRKPASQPASPQSPVSAAAAPAAAAAKAVN